MQSHWISAKRFGLTITTSPCLSFFLPFSHSLFSLYFFISFSLYFFLSLSTSVSFYLSFYLSFSLYSFLPLFLSPSFFLSFFISFFLPFSLSLSLSLVISFYLPCSLNLPLSPPLSLLSSLSLLLTDFEKWLSRSYKGLNKHGSVKMKKIANCLFWVLYIPLVYTTMELCSRRRWRLVSSQSSNRFGYCPLFTFSIVL